MLHLVRCMETRPYWNAVKHFVETVLEMQNVRRTDLLIIFNLKSFTEPVISTEACAFIRHAFNTFYRDFALVDTHDAKFTWQTTFCHTMRNFRNAVLAYGESIKSFLANRAYTEQKKRVPEDALTRFKTLITFTGQGTSFALTAAFQAAIDAAEQQHNAQANRRS